MTTKQDKQRSRKGEFTSLEKTPRKSHWKPSSYIIPQSLVDDFPPPPVLDDELRKEN